MKTIIFLSFIACVFVIAISMIWVNWLRYHPRISAMRSLSKREEEIFSIAKSALDIDIASVDVTTKNLKIGALDPTLEAYWQAISSDVVLPVIYIMSRSYSVSWDLWLRLMYYKENLMLEKHKDEILDSLLEKSSRNEKASSQARLSRVKS